MHAEEQARFFVDRAFVVAQARTIGGADLAKNCATFRHDVRDAEAIADFDQFAAGDYYFGGFGESVEDQENCGGVVVHDDGGFGSDEVSEQARGVDIALAALAARNIVFEIGIMSGVSAISAAAAVESGARPRFVCSTTPVALITRRREGASTRPTSSATRDSSCADSDCRGVGLVSLRGVGS